MTQPTDPIRVVVAGGGTAGHIEPALAVAEALKDTYNADVTALGTARGLETTLVPDRGFDLKLIEPVPVPRKPSADLLKLPVRVVKAINQTRKILKETQAQAVIGFGGYVSAPAYMAARSLRIPFFVHEANARAGMANKLGVKLGGVGLNAVEGSGMDGQVVGIPIRKGLGGDRDVAHADRARAMWDLEVDRTTILVTGGSQGSVSINNAVADGLDQLLAAGFQVLHAVGKKNVLPAAKPGYHPVPFIDDMQAAYAVADLIVCRSGAMTVAEVTAAGVPAIYVPLPHGNGEQALNAKKVIEAGGARQIDDADLNGKMLVDAILDILNNPATLQEMARAARNSGAGNASDVIAALIADTITHK
ncbi:UDP-N-acetylglucosamine-N-acetylmuramyl-(pentapeptide) pyrophosphoryl-undecaprenol N-acetylglucosamine transferase [Corynebacterium deserti GIMN1.010]|uniref:UDP-N-acetylglucosamine--N-acetylmuramyl-(pentapeptide) pyrophosphoryl-undecaprenol N-acetylglucosamine transferase n=1 Tax=Corynebacterium deserti GIMN1.010 TaxID=931089 RepID=A0A0M3Q9U9_9CORY|nr:undecaprenyldiphospho-muramoylpentapeptide beta-N-acetylglucosaminyltransferase [Corynebacterium deserti]ALC06339.1 UDP-N-acetylglucosamine-N-acetylmuramyl-(pentapeptide) pyrophosphoryl-undecaprenol N-acetylglucosamine transferase [Corynebacterium deserti GIMN1.010]